MCLYCRLRSQLTVAVSEIYNNAAEIHAAAMQQWIQFHGARSERSCLALQTGKYTNNHILNIEFGFDSEYGYSKENHYWLC